MISIHHLHAFFSVAHDLAELKQPFQALWLAPSFGEELGEQDGPIDSVCSAPNHFSLLPWMLEVDFFMSKGSQSIASSCTWVQE